jgi:hypothetical protein
VLVLGARNERKARVALVADGEFSCFKSSIVSRKKIKAPNIKISDVALNSTSTLAPARALFESVRRGLLLKRPCLSWLTLRGGSFALIFISSIEPPFSLSLSLAHPPSPLSLTVPLIFLSKFHQALNARELFIFNCYSMI